MEKKADWFFLLVMKEKNCREVERNIGIKTLRIFQGM